MKRLRSRSPLALQRFREAKVLAAAGDREQAVEGYLAAVAADPGFAEAHVNLGILYSQMGEAHQGDALRCLKRGVELNRSSARAHYNLGVALARGNAADEAIAAFEGALAIEQEHKNALYALAVQWNRRGDPARAATYHRRYQRAMAGMAVAPARDEAVAPSATPSAGVRAPSTSYFHPRSGVATPSSANARPFLRIRFTR